MADSDASLSRAQRAAVVLDNALGLHAGHIDRQRLVGEATALALVAIAQGHAEATPEASLEVERLTALLAALGFDEEGVPLVDTDFCLRPGLTWPGAFAEAIVELRRKEVELSAVRAAIARHEALAAERILLAQREDLLKRITDLSGSRHTRHFEGLDASSAQIYTVDSAPPDLYVTLKWTRK